MALALPGVSLLAAVNVWHWPAYWHGLATLVLTPLGLWFGVRVLARDEQTLLRLAVWLSAGGLVVAVWGLATWLLGAGVVVDGVQRLVGPHFSPNHTTLYLERTLFVALGLALATPRRRRLWALALCGVVLVALLLTGSRGALLTALGQARGVDAVGAPPASGVGAVAAAAPARRCFGSAPRLALR